MPPALRTGSTVRSIAATTSFEGYVLPWPFGSPTFTRQASAALQGLLGEFLCDVVVERDAATRMRRCRGRDAGTRTCDRVDGEGRDEPGPQSMEGPLFSILERNETAHSTCARRGDGLARKRFTKGVPEILLDCLLP